MPSRITAIVAFGSSDCNQT